MTVPRLEDNSTDSQGADEYLRISWHRSHRGDVRWPNGSSVNGQVYEFTADYLDGIGVI
jgi:hypothetical protein